MKNQPLICAIICAALFTIFIPENAQCLYYTSRAKSAVPIPLSERDLTTKWATHLKNVNKDDHTLEGALFDAKGNFYFCDVSASKVLKYTPNGALTVIAEFDNFYPSGLAFHPDGRLFVAGNSDGITRGAIYAMQPDGSDKTVILEPVAGFIPNDLVINSHGVIYFTDFKGNMTDPAGGVYYITPGSSTPELLVGNIANANGIALSPDEKILWIGDYGRSILFRIVLAETDKFNRIHSTPVYYFNGRGPDSMSIDMDGNLYVSIMSQGRTLVFNPVGIPIGQILLPGRDRGHNLYGASVAINPQKKEMILVARDDKGKGANLFRARAYAKGVMPPGKDRE